MHSNNIGKQITKLKVNKNKITITFLDNTKLVSDFSCIKKYHLKVGTKLSKKMYNELNEAILLDNEKRYLLRITSKHRYTKEEINRKLIKRNNVSKQDIDTLINYLSIHKFIDDNSYVYDYYETYTLKFHSYERIRHDLLKKGISKKEVNTLRFDYKEEYRKASRMCEYKLKRLKNYSYMEKKQKIYDSLQTLMFDKSITNEVISKYVIYSSKEELVNLRREYSIYISKYRYKYLGDLIYKKVIEYLLRKGYSFLDIIEIEKEFRT